jgi:hypothetical protein
LLQRVSLLAILFWIAHFFQVCRAQELLQLPPLSSSDLALQDNPASPGAPAIILYMGVETDNTKSTEVYSFRIKVFTDEGRKYAIVEIPYWEKLSRVEEIHARTISTDGKVHEFDGEILDQEMVKSRKLKMNIKILALPDVQVGTIIEYSYKLEFKEGVPKVFRDSAPQFYIHNYVYPAANWTLQRNLFLCHGSFVLRPVNAANIREFEIPLSDKVAQKREPHIYSSNPMAQGFSFPVKFQPDGAVTLQVDNIPAYEQEQFTLPEESLKARVDLYYAVGFTDPERFWIDVGERRADIYEPFMDRPKAMQKEIGQLLSPGDSDDAKLRKIYARVQSIKQADRDGTKSEKEFKQENLRANKSVEDVLSRGYAFGHEANLLFVALARAAGFRAFPILVTSRQTGVFRKDLPDERQLNAMVVLVQSNRPSADIPASRINTADSVQGKTVQYLDPGTPFCPFGHLPWYESGTQGVMIAYRGVQIGGVPYIEAGDALTQLDADLQLDTQGSIRGRAQVDFRGQEAWVWRDWAISNDEVKRREGLEDYLKAKLPPSASVRLLSASGWDTSEGSLHAQYSVEIPEIASSTGKRLLLPLGIFHTNAKNPLDSARRVHPVVFQYPYQAEESVHIQLPPDLPLEALPPAFKSDQNAAYFEISAQKADGCATVHRLLRIAESKFAAPEYPNLRLFYDKTLEGDSQQIVLRKVDTATAR